MPINIRSYTTQDYQQIIELYKQPELYGGVFDKARDDEDKLRKRIEADPDAILVAEAHGQIVGTVSLIEDGRVAWLFRFCVVKTEEEKEIEKALFDKAAAALKAKGHTQVLVYAPAATLSFHKRYETLQFTKSGDYTCFWKQL